MAGMWKHTTKCSKLYSRKPEMPAVWLFVERERERAAVRKKLLNMWGVPTKTFQVSVQVIPL